MKLGVAIILGAIFASASQGQAQTPPTVKMMNCTEGGCHAKQLDHQFLHGPTAVSACDACHEYQDPARHTFVFKRPGRQLCDFCHIDKTGTEGPVVHQPVAKGECTSCHDPHGSPTRRMLKKATTPELCASCHKDILAGSHIHRPAGDNCIDCHMPHTASQPKLLKMEKRDLCVSCHAEVGKGITSAPHAHKPAEGDCTQCHQPHSSDQPKVLKAALADLCVSCHQGVGTSIAAATHPHTATTDGKACLNCHMPHGSQHAKQLKDDPVAACLACHSKPINAANNRVIQSVAEIAVATNTKHGPIAKGECAACHNVHGGDARALLVVPYEADVNQAYTDQSYALCFKCHDRAQLVGGGVDTKFRDGERNLHIAHVAKMPQGRNCRACHAIHAAKSDKMVAENVLFGQWNLPIKFTPTETGGSCAPGCHKPASYDRDHPVGKPPGPSSSGGNTAAAPKTAPGTPAATPPAPGQTPAPGPAPSPAAPAPAGGAAPSVQPTKSKG